MHSIGTSASESSETTLCRSSRAVRSRGSSPPGRWRLPFSSYRRRRRARLRRFAIVQLAAATSGTVRNRVCDGPVLVPLARASRPGPGLPDELEGGLSNCRRSRQGRWGQCRCRVAEHRDHHDGLAGAVRGQIAHGQHSRRIAALEPDRGPPRRVKSDPPVAGRQDGIDGRQRGLGCELLESDKGAADCHRARRKFRWCRCRGVRSMPGLGSALVPG